MKKVIKVIGYSNSAAFDPELVEYADSIEDVVVAIRKFLLYGDIGHCSVYVTFVSDEEKQD